MSSGVGIIWVAPMNSPKIVILFLCCLAAACDQQRQENVTPVASNSREEPASKPKEQGLIPSQVQGEWVILWDNQSVQEACSDPEYMGRVLVGNDRIDGYELHIIAQTKAEKVKYKDSDSWEFDGTIEMPDSFLKSKIRINHQYDGILDIYGSDVNLEEMERCPVGSFFYNNSEKNSDLIADESQLVKSGTENLHSDNKKYKNRVCLRYSYDPNFLKIISVEPLIEKSYPSWRVRYEAYSGSNGWIGGGEVSCSTTDIGPGISFQCTSC